MCGDAKDIVETFTGKVASASISCHQEGKPAVWTGIGANIKSDGIRGNEVHARAWADAGNICVWTMTVVVEA
ncbi:hypothetical protein OEZ85_009470 [Tetradesmus obliquus]|uniref:Uncharacterized protein n=1 Tax=Tetradesmus obliquus TaxID=3088 RepID=A0ABY8U928_TETOB|nr:hypothetical protein OEZ85_009470 [Tetradesmus obliquus]